MRKNIVISGMIIAFACFACGQKSEVASGKTLVQVNGYKITEGDLGFLTAVNPRASLYLATPANRRQVIDSLVEKELLYQSALKEGLNKSPEVKAQIDYNNHEILAKARLEKAVNEAAKKYYDAHRDEFEQVKISYILIRSKDKKKDNIQNSVQQIRSRLNAGETFEKMAKEISDDPLTKERGGDLGWVTRNDTGMVRRGLSPLLSVAFTLKKGAISDAIQVDNGFCIVTVTDGPSMKPFDEVKGSIVSAQQIPLHLF